MGAALASSSLISPLQREMTPVDWSFLKSTVFFKAMPAEDARSLIGNQSPRTYPKGVTLFRQGEPAWSLND